MAKAKEVVEKVVETVETVKVELITFIKGGTHTVYHKLGSTMFVDGVAEVAQEVANELKELGLVK